MNLTTVLRSIRFGMFVILFCLPNVLLAQINAAFNADKTGGCSPLTVNFSNFTTGVSSNAKYSWDFGNGNSSTLKSPGAVFIEEKTYTVTLNVTDGAAKSSRSLTITVYKKPVADFKIGAAKVCLPDAASFQSTSTSADGAISSYYWDFGDGTNQQGFNASMSHNYFSEQTPNVSLTVTSSYGCQASIVKPKAIEILGRINPQFSVDKPLLCNLGESIQLSNTSTGPGALSYSWNFGDGGSSTLKEPSHTYSSKAVYNVSLTVTNADGCKATSGGMQVNAAYFNTNFNSNSLCREASFNASSFLYPSQILWKFGDAQEMNGFSLNTSHVYATPGDYNVSLINTYQGCKDTVTKKITIKDLVNYNSAIVIPSVICRNSSYAFQSTSSVNPGTTQWDFGDGSFGFGLSTTHTYFTPGTYTITLKNTFGTCTETVTRTVVVNDLPDVQGFVADYGGVCGAPVTITFKDTSKNATSWEWYDDRDGVIHKLFATGKTVTRLYNSNAIWWVNLTAKTAAGCAVTVNRMIPVQNPSGYISYTYSSSARGTYDCDSLRIRFNANINQMVTSYFWRFGDGQTSTLAEPEHFYDKPGDYSVSLDYVTESGCKGYAVYSVRVYNKPKAQFNYTIPCGRSLDVMFRDASFFSDNWEWKFLDNNFPGFGAAPIHTYADTGRYKVTFINHIGHCSDTTTGEVYANVLPSFASITKAVNTCDGDRATMTFDQNSLRITGGTWDFGDGTTMPYDTSKHNITHTFPRTGSFVVRLNSTSANCTFTDVRTVFVLKKQSPILTADKTEICSSDQLKVQLSNFEANAFYGNIMYGQYSIQKFEYNDGTQYQGFQNAALWDYTKYTATLSNFSAGTSQLRVITLSSFANCADTSNFISLKVNGPRAGFKLAANNLCFKSPFIFTDTSKTLTSTPLVRWDWDFGDGKLESYTKSTTVSHLYTAPGNYQVRLTVADASGCVSIVTMTVNARGPKASFVTSGLFVPNVPLNTTVNFYNNTISWFSNSVVYNWKYGDGATSTDYSGNHTYTQPGTNTVILIASDPTLGCADTATQVINVKEFNSAFTFSTSPITTNNCPPVNVRINNLSVGTTRVEWNFGDGTTTSDQFYPSHIYTKPGLYKITLNTFGYNGLTGTYIDSVKIEEPVGSISSSITMGCSGENVSLVSTNKDLSNYLWDFGDGTLQNASSTGTHAFSSAGIFEPRLVMKNATGCATASVLGEKIIIDSLNVAIKGIPALICDSTAISFTPDVYSAITERNQSPLVYHWDFGTGIPADTANIKNPVFNYNKTGTFTVRLSVWSAYGCKKEVSAQVVVRKKSKGAINGPTEICQFGSANFKGTASLNPDSWQWYFGNSGNTPSSAQPVAERFDVPGKFLISMIVNYQGCSDTTKQEVTVHPKPNAQVKVSSSQVCLGNSSALTASGGSVYQWSPAADISVQGASVVVTPLKTSTYSVEVISDKGCRDTASATLTVIQPFKLALPAELNTCLGIPLTLNASGANTYLWTQNTSTLSNTQVANPVARPMTNTSYTVIGFDAYQCFRDTATVMVNVRPLPTVVCEPDVQMLAASSHQIVTTASSDVVSWTWTPDNFLSCTNCPSPVASPRVPLDYIVTVKNQYGCEASDTIGFKLQCSDELVFIPNAFTPDHDGNNDLFYIKGKGIGIIKSLTVYSRWGEAVFARKNFNIDDPSSGWDGTYKGAQVPAGSYVYILEMQCDGGSPVIKRGTITLVR